MTVFPDESDPDRPETELKVKIRKALAALKAPAAPGVPPSDPLEYRHGEVVAGRFTLEHMVARGGSAVVWQCRTIPDGRKVAVKLPHSPHPNPDRDINEQFLREGECVWRLFHHNIVPVYSFGRHGDVAYVAFKLVEGESLAARLRRVGRVEPTEVLSIAWAIASALAYAHERGLIHRDLKPANILLATSGRVYLTDFGIALTLDEADDGCARVTGTPSYAAPEQLTGAPLNPSCDVYLFGLILFRLLTGRLPTRHEPCTDPALSDFGQLLRKCLAPEPENRYRSGSELVSALGSLMPPGTLPGRIVFLPPLPPTPPSTGRLNAKLASPTPAPRRAPLVPVVIAVLAAAALVIGGLSLVGARADHVRAGPVTVVLIATCLALGVAIVRPQRTALGYLLVACVGLVVAAVIGGAAESLLRSITGALNGALRLP